MNNLVSNFLIYLMCGSFIFILSCQNKKKHYNQESIPNDSLIMEEEISVFPSQFTYRQIESFYSNFKDYENNLDLEPIMIRLQTYLEEIKRGVNPFEIFEDPSLSELRIDTSILVNFLKDLSPIYFKIKKEKPQIFGSQEWNLNPSMSFPQEYFYFSNGEDIKEFILNFEKSSTTSALPDKLIFKEISNNQFYGTYNLLQQIESDSIQHLGYVIAKVNGKMKDWKFNVKPNEVVYLKTSNPRIQFWNGIRIGNRKIDITNSINLDWKEKNNSIVVKDKNEGFFILGFGKNNRVNEIKYVKSKFRNWNSILKNSNFSRINSVN